MLYRVHDALVTLYQHDWAGAAAGLDDVLDIEPDHLVARALRAALHLYAGELDAGHAAFTRLAAQFPKLSMGRCGLAQVHAMRGDVAAARRELDQLKAIFEAGYLSPYQIAMVHARLREPDAAVHWLAESSRLRDFNFVCVAVDPTFERLHGHAGYRQLLRSSGFGHLVTTPPL